MEVKDIKRNIFLEKNVTCPSCLEVSATKYPNPRLYVAASREADEHVTAYRWAQGISSDTKPHFYFVWQCPHCNFADIRSNVEDVNKRVLSRRLGSFYKKIPPETQSLISKLHLRMPKGDELDQFGAVILHLTAYLIAIAPENAKDVNHYNVGRIAIRLGWLYREIAYVPEESEEDETPEQPRDEAGLQGAIEAMKPLLDALSYELSDLREKALIRSRNLGLDESEETNPYDSVTSTMADKLDDIKSSLELLQRTAIDDQSTPPVPAEKVRSTKPAAAQGSGDLELFLNKIAGHWEEMPQSESTCLNIAVAAFTYSFEHESSFQSVESSMSVLSLIVELNLKLGNPDDALKWIGQSHRLGMKNRGDLQQRIAHGKADKTLSARDERILTNKMSTINLAIRQVGDRRKAIVEVLLGKYKDQIKAILTQTNGQPLAARQAALVEAGIPEDLLPALKEKGVLKEDKKKGWFR